MKTEAELLSQNFVSTKRIQSQNTTSKKQKKPPNSILSKKSLKSGEKTPFTTNKKPLLGDDQALIQKKGESFMSNGIINLNEKFK